MKLTEYQKFVESVTSDESNKLDDMVKRLTELELMDVNTALLLTSSIGLSSEGGEFSEIVKKTIFQGKPFNEDVRFHLLRELGDILWYWSNACRALDINPDEVLHENVRKLESRYPGGEFDTWFSV